MDTPNTTKFTITSNFDNDNFLTSPQNISFDLQAITQLKQLLAVVVHMTSQCATILISKILPIIENKFFCVPLRHLPYSYFKFLLENNGQ